MDLFEIIIIYLQITKVLSRRKPSSSSESIENLLYYKDFRGPTAAPTTTARAVVPSPVPLRLQSPPEQFPCQFPKMCCSISCNNECQGPNNHQRPKFRSHSNPDFHMQSPLKNPDSNFLPMMSRRKNPEFTKEKIKSLISQDGDIRKILKELVRVTMQKVDLMALLKSRRAGVNNVKGELSYSNEDIDEL